MQRDPLITTFLAKNAQINLSAIRTGDGVYAKHILDSIELSKIFFLRPGTSLVDVGTGGGFPLLPLAMTNPNVTCVGIDARRKKIDAINDMITTLQIPNAKAVWTRSEDHKQTYDYVTARAVTYIDALLPLVHHLIKPSGYLFLYKLYTEEEHVLVKKLAPYYHLHLTETHHYQLLDDTTARVLYILEKTISDKKK